MYGKYDLRSNACWKRRGNDAREAGNVWQTKATEAKEPSPHILADQSHGGEGGERAHSGRTNRTQTWWNAAGRGRFWENEPNPNGRSCRVADRFGETNPPR